MINSTTPQTSLEGKKVKPFGLKDQIGYMFGDMANCLLFIGMSMFLAGFYRDVLGLNPLYVGTMMMIIKFLDAFTDIGMGRICDRFRGTKAGKFKPWILWLSAPVALSSFLMYQSYMANTAEWVKWVYAIITYVLFNSIFYTGINIPYGSMASAMVTSPQDRAKLSAWRGLGPTIAGLGLSMIPLFYKGLYNANNQTQGTPILIVTGVLAALSIGIYLACYFMCTERVDLNQRTAPRPSLIKSLGNIFKSKAFIILAIVTIIQVVIQLGVSDINRYLYGVVFYGTPGFQPQAAGQFSALYQIIGSVATIVLVTPVTIQLVKRFGKKLVTIYSTLTGGVIYFLMFVFGPLLRKNVWAYLFVSVVPFIVVGAMTAITFAFITDIVDDMEVKNGVREDAPVYGIYSFIRKFAQGLATQLGGVVLTATHYDPKANITDNLGSAVSMYNTLTLSFAIGFVAIGLLFLFLYPLGKKVVEQNAQILRERRAKLANDNAANFSADPMSMEEAASLEAGELIQNEEILNKNHVDNNRNNTINHTDSNDLRQQLRDYDENNKNNNKN